MAVSDTLINTVFDGRYCVLRKLGSGGMANVYLAEDGELGRQVAIKILNDRHAADDQFIERFRREAKNAAGLSHPNIVQIYDRGEAEGTYYIAMEYLEGRTLKEAAGRQPLPIREAIGYVREILAALRFAHRNGIVHRDIKPHNALMDDDGRLKVSDFGIARAGAASQMTEAGSIIGTAQYLSPEQAKGAAVDHRSDLYSLGIVLYELLTGSVPFTGDTPVEIAMKHLGQAPEPPSLRRPEIPRDLDYVVLRALAKDAAERYRTAAEMDSDLERIARGVGVSAETAEAATSVLSRTEVTDALTTVRPAAATAYTPGRYYEYDAAPRRRSIWPWLLALLLLAGSLVGGFFLYERIQDQLSATAQVTVPDVVGIQESLAVADIRDKGLEPNVRRLRHPEVERGIVYGQEPEPPVRTERGNFVTIFVSSGKPRVQIPNVVGRSRDDAVAALRDANLRFRVVEINSGEAVNSVTAQAPKAGEVVVEGTQVRINISKGPKPIPVPNVVGMAYESAASVLQGSNFAVAREDVEDDAPTGTVVAQNPAADTLAGRGATVTLQVSIGPSTSTVPDVTSQDEASASDQITEAGFRVRVQDEETTDESLDGIVISQAPEGGSEEEPNAIITLFVGRFTEE